MIPALFAFILSVAFIYAALVVGDHVAATMLLIMGAAAGALGFLILFDQRRPS